MSFPRFAGQYGSLFFLLCFAGTVVLLLVTFRAYLCAALSHGHFPLLYACPKSTACWCVFRVLIYGLTVPFLSSSLALVFGYGVFRSTPVVTLPRIYGREDHQGRKHEVWTTRYACFSGGLFGCLYSSVALSWVLGGEWSHVHVHYGLGFFCFHDRFILRFTFAGKLSRAFGVLFSYLRFCWCLIGYSVLIWVFGAFRGQPRA